MSFHLRFSAEPLVTEETGEAFLAELLVAQQVLAEAHAVRTVDTGGWTRLRNDRIYFHISNGRYKEVIIKGSWWQK